MLSEPTLKRTIGFFLLTLYGLGTILGAGIYVLIGEVARVAGSAAPSAFAISAIIAGFTAFSYAELSGRLPRSAGEAAYLEEGFHRPVLSAAVGWAVIATGVVSSATLVRGFVGYLDIFVALPDQWVIGALVLIVAGVAAWGISESLIAAGIITGIEVLGLLFVCVVARDGLGSFPERWTSFVPGPDSTVLAGVLSGAFIAFYAFIGFEDMVNVAEEVKQPERTLPKAIVAALFISTALYMLVAVVATLSLPQDVLAGSAAPLAVIVESRGVSPRTIALVSLFAVINGALIQLVMASRVLYGLGSQGLAWNGFARVHAVSRTPLVATFLAAVVILCFALTLSLDRLARLTSFIALGVFTAVNLSLLKLKREEPFGPEFTVPKVVPIIGALLCAGMILYQVTAFLQNFDS